MPWPKGRPHLSKQRYSDAEIEAAIEANQGNLSKTAADLGYTHRALMKRRRVIEDRNDAPILASTHKLRLHRSRHKAVVSTEIDSGVILIGSDVHVWPGVRTTAMEAFKYFAANYDPRPLAVVINGDLFDGASISRHPKIGFLERAPTVKEELDACIEYTTEIEDASTGNCRLIHPLGNHDLRFESYLASVAHQYEGLTGFHLKDWLPRWEPCWGFHINPNTDDWTEIKHRNKGGMHATTTNVRMGGVHTVTGHLHSAQVRPVTNRRGTFWGVDTGTLAAADGPQFTYLEANPVDWRSAFAVLTYHKGRLLQPELCLVLDEDAGLVQFRGQVIEV